jgi:hypothetical protein
MSKITNALVLECVAEMRDKKVRRNDPTLKANEGKKIPEDKPNPGKFL